MSLPQSIVLGKVGFLTLIEKYLYISYQETKLGVEKMIMV